MYVEIGYSHKPEEWSAPEDLTNGVKVLAITLAIKVVPFLIIRSSLQVIAAANLSFSH
ncbi:hypothetical protein BVRB_2g040870 [Beta vulgaris subsp. vulgaris]|nr:hypothetical protein BVRB_2g040870 [Beta vulgaris subsp. vulgaris]